MKPRASTAVTLPKHITAAERARGADLRRNGALALEDPARPPTIRPGDPGDDEVIALAESARAVVVSGDEHLLRLAGDLPVSSPAASLELLNQRG